jgi:mannose-6-phosphate isomerase-like protein (cupin superfamily)
MPKVSKDTATQGGEYGPVTDRSDAVEGYSVNFVTFNIDMDQSPMLRGLPNDECQCPHWGYVLKGRFTFRSGGREEVFEAGDAFYLPPGHVGVGNEPGSELVQFSPSDELKKTSDVIMKNMQAMQEG